MRQSTRNKANSCGRDRREIIYGKGVIFDSGMMQNKPNWSCRADGGDSPPYQMAKEPRRETKPIGWEQAGGNCENKANLHGLPTKKRQKGV